MVRRCAISSAQELATGHLATPANANWIPRMPLPKGLLYREFRADSNDCVCRTERMRLGRAVRMVSDQSLIGRGVAACVGNCRGCNHIRRCD
jgi:hypothetical protein